MNHLRRAGISLAAVALLLGGAPSLAHADTPTPTPPSESTTTSGSPSTKPAKPVVDTSWIRLDSLAPATIPTKGNIVVTGTLHNGSGQTWHQLSVMPATSQYPLTSRSAVDFYATYDPAQVHLGGPMQLLSAQLGDLANDATARFRITIPRADLPIHGQTGVYWLGVTPFSAGQPIGALTARTYFPLLPQVNKKAHVNISLVIPLRGEPLRNTSGQVADPNAFTSLLSSQGRLGRIAEFGQAASGRALTWLVDPALLDLADQTANGVSDYGVNTVDASSSPTPTPTSARSASPAPSGSPSGTTVPPPTGTHAGPNVTTAQATTIRGWSSTIATLLGGASTYALPYGDPAVGALFSTGNDGLFRQAVADSAQSMKERHLVNTSAVAPPSGNLTQDVWAALDSGQAAFVNDSTSTATSSVTSNDRTLIVASPASDGGPGPVGTKSALNLRQRLLADASIAMTNPTSTSLTVVLPADWDPGTAAGTNSFFGPLSRRWISFTSLSPDVAASTPVMHRAATAITSDQSQAVSAALRLQGSADRLRDLLATTYDKSVLMRQFSATELATLSSSSTAQSKALAANAVRTAGSLDNLLATVRVEGTQFVTLSGSSGIITVAIHNGLNLPITVGLSQIDKPNDSTVSVNSIGPMTFEPGERTTVRLTVTAPRVSVQEVILSAIDATKVPVGTPLVFTLRSSPVGAVVWAVTIAIVLVLALIAGRRMRRRLKSRRETS